jgi:hypothetical protein
LVDSGTLRLYRAKVINIIFSDKSTECIEIDKVPEYYAFKKCLAWFCFANIDDISSEDICSWVYDDPLDFVVETEPDKYKGKRITSITELVKSRHRTMYFIRQYKTNSKNSFHELEYYSNSILILIEEINKLCDLSLGRNYSPIKLPLYQKEIEERLKTPAEDDILFREFSSTLYILIVDGHDTVLKNNSSIITIDEFLKFSNITMKNIRIFRCYHHHSSVSNKEKFMLGNLFKQLCGKTMPNDPESMVKFQLQMLKMTNTLLSLELAFIKHKIDKLPSNP